MLEPSLLSLVAARLPVLMLMTLLMVLLVMRMVMVMVMVVVRTRRMGAIVGVGCEARRFEDVVDDCLRLPSRS